MLFRLVSTAVLAISLGSPLVLAAPALAKDPAPASATPAPAAPAPATPKAAPAKEPSVSQSAARDRQKKCGAEWRALSVADKAAQGPKWPQYYSKCVKRLKEMKA